MVVYHVGSAYSGPILELVLMGFSLKKVFI